MTPQQLQAASQQSLQQGNQLLNSDIAQQNQYKSQADQFTNQANAANQQLQDYTKYMQGAGSGTNLYNTELGNLEQQQGFDPSVLARATQNLTQAQNALYNVNQAAQSSTGGYGLSGAQLGNYYASQAAPITNQIQAQGQAVGNFQQLLQNAMTGANQYAGVGVQGEQATSSALNQVFQNAQNQASVALQNMQQFATLAQQQGGLNAQEQQAYDTAIQEYQSAQAAAAQAGLYAAQTQGQNLQNTYQGLKNQYTQSNMNAAFGQPAASKAQTAPASTQKPSSSNGFSINNILGTIGHVLPFIGL